MWTPECQCSFDTLKESLCTSLILQSPNCVRIYSDASDRGIGAVLSQRDSDDIDHPIAYYSKKLLPREERYATVEKECLAIKMAIESFRVYLSGRHFTIETDHRALEWLQRSRDKNGRLTRWSLALQPYNIVYCKGAANGNADGLLHAFDDASTPANPTTASQEKCHDNATT